MSKMHNKKIPTLRFSGFLDKWERKTFTELFDFGSTNSLSRENLEYREDGIFNIHYGDIHTRFSSHFNILKEKVPVVTKDIGLSSMLDKNKLVEMGDVVIADASEDYEDIGKAIEIISTNRKVVIAGLHTILGKNINNKLATGFIGHLMKSPNQRHAIKRIAQGAKVLGLPKMYFKNLDLSIPQKPEQQKIANFLGSVDEWLENLRAQKKSSEEYKKGMMQKIFPAQGQRVPEIQFKDENGNEFGEWDEKKLGEICEVITKGTTPTSVGYKFISKGANFIKVENISSNFFINIKATPKISAECNKTLSRSKLKVNDILFSIAGTLGRTAIVQEKDLPANTNQAVAIVRLNNNQNIKFVNYFLNSISIKKRVYQLLSVGAQPNLSLEQIGSFKLNLPQKQEQKKIAEFLTSFDSLIESKQKQISQAEKWKKGLMQGLFI